jgi:hypothetical protein
VVERAWVLDRCLGSFKGILEFKSAEDEGEDVSTDQEADEDSNEDLDFKIQLFQASKNDPSELMESTIIKDFEARILQAEEQEDDLAAKAQTKMG